ncbi:glucose dehydrogenase [FAD, quinone]-like isoform X3 [Varroa jacobsoni]|uniref:glucose dehydrogenase [FAD, quinone]-like isoform X3 n=1 Tax=Varroa jacobsoni TaxID=62625 RepID=UPI000BF80694|nr:glucose dehydrogenase [FAD, quinone]-like isoform X3 [Varroa jacobsoni]
MGTEKRGQSFQRVLLLSVMAWSQMKMRLLVVLMAACFMPTTLAIYGMDGSRPLFDIPILPALIPFSAFIFVRFGEQVVPFQAKQLHVEYDYIVVGGGSAGAALANRLSEDQSASVLLVEAGGIENEVSDIPLIAATLQLSPLDWQYVTEPQDASCFGFSDRRSLWPRGKVLGGSSVLNYMLYVRASPHDYDTWSHYGNYGWSWKEVFPYFLKSEDNRDPVFLKNGYHATGGYMTVSTPPYSTPLGRAFIQAGIQMGYPNVDVNGPTMSGFMIPQGTIRRGARCSTSKAFMKPVRHRKNLHITLYSLATKIHFDLHKRARAVQFERFKVPHIAYARREIILSAGAINSPQLLMLSGIGPAHHLSHLGIKVIADLPVGQNLQDHIYTGGLNFHVKGSSSVTHERAFTLKNVMTFLTVGKGPLSLLGGVEGIAFINTKFANTSIDYPDIEIHYVTGAPTADGGQVFRRAQGFADELWERYYIPHLYKDGVSIFPVLLRPKSRGFLKLRTISPYDPPTIDPKYLTHPHDIRTLVEGMKFCISLSQTPAFKAFDTKLWAEPIPGCEHYSSWSDEYLACMARTITSTIYHPVGTCKMGPAWDSNAVVDPELSCWLRCACKYDGVIIGVQTRQLKYFKQWIIRICCCI